jgi:hypothetical protein
MITNVSHLRLSTTRWKKLVIGCLGFPLCTMDLAWNDRYSAGCLNKTNSPF